MIGEVAAIDGRCYGLVAPGYTTAEVVADRLLGGEAEFPGADMSTKLKLLGVDVASFGDAQGHTPNCLEVAVNDPVKPLTIGVAKEYFSGGLDGEVEAAIRTALKEYEKLGATVKEVSLPHSPYAVAVY